MDVVRSTWEESIEAYIRRSHPELRVESNNRSIIPSRNTRRSYLEIDIFIPELSLGIEANGEAYHNREKYKYDQQHSTEFSDEMYKKNYCTKVGIKLIHVWSSQDMQAVQLEIDDAIQQRLADPATQEWHQRRASALPDSVLQLLVPVGCLAMYAGSALTLFGVAFSAYFLVFIGSDPIGPLDPGRHFLPTFFAGYLGFCLVALMNDLDAEPRGFKQVGLHRFAGAALVYLVSYLALVLMFAGALGILILLIEVFNGFSISEFYGPLAIAALAGVVGLVLKRLLSRGGE